MTSSTPAAIVTGCASGIGRDLAGALAAAGYRVLATDHDEVGLRAARADWPHEVLTDRLDVREPDDWAACVAQVVEAFGHLDLLVHVAGVAHPHDLLDITLEEVALQLDTNARGVVLGTRAAASVMVDQGAGHIVQINSIAGLTPTPGLSVYSASKFAARAFCLSVAGELRSHGVYMTVVYPDAVDTPLTWRELWFDEAVLVFSGPRVLPRQDLTDLVVGRVLRRRPLEVFLPRHRGLLCKLASALPGLGLWLLPLLLRRGRANQLALRALAPPVEAPEHPSAPSVPHVEAKAADHRSVPEPR